MTRLNTAESLYKYNAFILDADGKIKYIRQKNGTGQSLLFEDGRFEKIQQK